MCDHTACSHHQAVTSVQQTIDELDFERGIWTAVLDNDEARVRQLLQRGVNVDAKDKAGYTALHYAARSGPQSMCELLLRSGAAVNATTRAGQASPLHRAAMTGRVEIIELLLKYGADLHLRDSDGKTAAERAEENKHGAAFQLLQKAAQSL